LREDFGDPQPFSPVAIFLVQAYCLNVGVLRFYVSHRDRRAVLLYQSDVDRRCELPLTDGLFASTHGRGC